MSAFIYISKRRRRRTKSSNDAILCRPLLTIINGLSSCWSFHHVPSKNFFSCIDKLSIHSCRNAFWMKSVDEVTRTKQVHAGHKQLFSNTTQMWWRRTVEKNWRFTHTHTHTNERNRRHSCANKQDGWHHHAYPEWNDEIGHCSSSNRRLRSRPRRARARAPSWIEMQLPEQRMGGSPIHRYDNTFILVPWWIVIYFGQEMCTHFFPLYPVLFHSTFFLKGKMMTRRRLPSWTAVCTAARGLRLWKGRLTCSTVSRTSSVLVCGRCWTIIGESSCISRSTRVVFRKSIILLCDLPILVWYLCVWVCVCVECICRLDLNSFFLYTLKRFHAKWMTAMVRHSTLRLLVIAFSG